jgi:Predicted permease
VQDVERLYRELPAPVIDAIRNNQYRLYLAVESVLARVTGMVTALPNIGFILVISFFAAFFMSRDKREISEFLVSLTPSRWREKARAMRAEVVSAALGFIRAQFILIMITTVVSIVGFSIAGTGYAWLLGIVCGILDLIPVVGPGTLYVPMIVYYAFKRRLFEAVVIAALMAVQFVLRKGAEPRVVGANVGVHPLAILDGGVRGYAAFRGKWHRNRSALRYHNQGHSPRGAAASYAQGMTPGYDMLGYGDRMHDGEPGACTCRGVV